MIAKILYKLFRKKFIRLVFEDQRKPMDKADLNFCFIDSEGKRYWQYPDDKLMPIVRKGWLEFHFMQLSCMIHDGELSLIIDAFNKALNSKDKKTGKPYIDVSMIAHLVKELSDRRQHLIHPDILIDIAATVFIREDENPAEVDMEIHIQKVEQLKKDSKGGLYDFFYQHELTRYVPFSHTYANELEQLILRSRIRIEAQMEQLRRYISESESLLT